MSKPTVISAFAGCGGSSLGYQMAGYDERLAVEWDDNAVETFKANFAGVPVYHGDIAKLTVKECLRLAGVKVGELDVLDGSPPCQGFSTAGKRVMADTRNQLFKEFVRLLRGLKPKCFVMENVSGMVKGKMKLIFVEILKELKASGYRVSARLLNAMYYGVPQSRTRLIFIGVRDDLEYEPSHPSPKTRPASVRSVAKEEADKNYVSFRNRGGGKYNSSSSADKPLPTIMKAGVDYYNAEPKDRKVSLAVLQACQTFPPSWNWSTINTSMIEAQLGNSVPPLMMKAIAQHIKTEVLNHA